MTIIAGSVLHRNRLVPPAFGGGRAVALAMPVRHRGAHSSNRRGKDRDALIATLAAIVVPIRNAAPPMSSIRAFLLQFLATAFVALVSFGVSVALAGLMGPAGFGSYVGIVTVASALALFQDAGLRMLVTREQTAPTQGTALPASELVALACGHLLLASAAILGFVLLVPVGDAAALAWAVVAFGAIALLQLGSALLKARGAFARDAGWQIVARAASATAIVAAAWLAGAQPAVVFAAWAVALLLLVPLHPELRRLRPRFALTRMPYRAAAGFLVVDLATLIYNRADILLLSLLAADRGDIGRYAAGYRLFDGAMLLIVPAATVLFRKLRLAHVDPVAFGRLLRRALAVATVSGAGAAMAGWIFGPWLTGLFFGESYGPRTGEVLRWLSLALVFALPNAVLSQAAIAGGSQRLYATGAIAAACANLGLNLALIPACGIVGAAWATVATEAVLGSVLWLGLRRTLRSRAAATTGMA
jgi:O-antigen/teichoic acid export membrane protein